MHTRLVTVLALAGAVMYARPSGAQTWSDHARISVNFGSQSSSLTFNGTTSVPVYQQVATYTTAYSVPSGQFFDGGIAVRVSGNWGVEIAASAFSRSQAGSITGSIPHPLISSLSRSIGGTSGPLERREIIGRIDAAYVISSDRVDVVLTGGPSFFTVDQDLVSDVTFADPAPYSTATFTGAVVSRATVTQIGFNAGIDVGVKLSKYVGVGAAARYSRASLTFPLERSAAGVSADAGGMQAGGGLRFYF